MYQFEQQQQLWEQEGEYGLTKTTHHRSRCQAVDVIDLPKTEFVEALLGWGMLQDCDAIILDEHHSINNYPIHLRQRHRHKHP